jgi:hypothetical protein
MDRTSNISWAESDDAILEKYEALDLRQHRQSSIQKALSRLDLRK